MSTSPSRSTRPLRMSTTAPPAITNPENRPLVNLRWSAALRLNPISGVNRISCSASSCGVKTSGGERRSFSSLSHTDPHVRSARARRGKMGFEKSNVLVFAEKALGFLTCSASNLVKFSSDVIWYGRKFCRTPKNPNFGVSQHIFA